MAPEREDAPLDTVQRSLIPRAGLRVPAASGGYSIDASSSDQRDSAAEL